MSYTEKESTNISPPQSPLPPPAYKSATLNVQQSPLASHPLPIYLPPPSYKRSSSPSPSIDSQPSLQQLPKYVPRVSTSSSAAPSQAPELDPWSSWIPWTRIPASRDEEERSEGRRRGRDSMVGERNDTLDEIERHEARQLMREDEGDWCCGCFWVAPPSSTAPYRY
ncbi:hypothetical protein PZA11_001142 [Diplocarpon coronariae]